MILLGNRLKGMLSFFKHEEFVKIELFDFGT
jgi:hypothetical protein